jgi:NAD+ kinase
VAEHPNLDGPIGLVVHPKRKIDRALDSIREWADAHGVQVGQVPVEGQDRRVADPVDATDCSLIVAVGGDGTALAALHTAAHVDRPVLGVACGSIGALTSVGADRVGWALDEVAAGRFTARKLPALDIRGDESFVALNDMALVRNGTGQLITSISIDGALYARVAGDGVIVSTPLGSSAYTLAAGGPLLTPACDTFAVTPVAPHGGSVPALVADSASEVTLEADPGWAGMRLEVDGQTMQAQPTRLVVTRRPGYATLVELTGGEPMLAGLRRRGLIVDSPRAVLRGERG